MTATVLYRIDATKRMHRFYRLHVQRDLFGAWCLFREWGRIGALGCESSTPYPSPHEAEQALAKQRRVKERRGYAERVGA